MYYEFKKPGETVKGLYMGTGTVKSHSDEIDLECVQWVAPDGIMYCNAGKALIEKMDELCISKWTEIEIKYLGKEENTKLYDVRVLTEWEIARELVSPSGLL